MALRVVICSHQDGKARYPSNGQHDAPKVSGWRNNLTALSQYRNLLFVAYVDKIHVFIPEFPSQKLPRKPELIVDLPVSGQGLRGYNDPSNPHAVTHLIVGDIGSEEVLVASCDDGDVIAYTIRSLDLALEAVRKTNTADQAIPVLSSHSRHGKRRRRFHGDNQYRDLSCSPVVEPWLLHNVGLSAWGLATHKVQRLLAVSSNTKTITVLVFSLNCSPDLGEADLSIDLAHVKAGVYEKLKYDPYVVPYRWKSASVYSPRSRFQDFKIDLDHHKDNIPSIAFYDSDGLDEGTYLASTDIKGNVCIWDVWNAEVVLEKHGHVLYSTVGWGVACLDPKTSRCTEDQMNTFGCQGQTDEHHTILDISEGARSIADNSQWHPGFLMFGLMPAPNPSVELVMIQPAAASAIDIDGDSEFDSIDDGTDEDALEESDEMDPAEDEEAENDFESPLGSPSAITDEPSIVNPHAFTYMSEPNRAVNPFRSTRFTYLTLDDPSQAPWIPQEAAQQIAGEPTCKFSGPARPQRFRLPFNLLQTSKTDIHLLRDLSYYKDHTRPKGSYSQVIFQQAIHQRFPPGLHHLSSVERLNMILQVPELGVVVIGNQAGRVSVLTMTRWQAQRQSGYKIECILPFWSQEEEGLRPKQPLMGMAVGPIQGHETKPDAGSTMDASDSGGAEPRVKKSASRRFRLMIFYCDHTVLSYEISRPNEGVEMLVV